MTDLTAIVIGDEALTRHCAELWLERGHGIAALVTAAPDLRAWAETRGLRVEAPGRDLGDRLAGTGCDWLLSIANLSVLPAPVLALARQGAVNFHDGPLPRHAGLNAPVWALWEGETEHGITWHLIEGGVDEGDILLQRTFALDPAETALTLNAKCFETALESFPALVETLERGAPERRAQDLSLRSLHRRDDRPEAFGLLDLSWPAGTVARRVRALDHGEYRNPLACAKVMLDGRVFLVGAAKVLSGEETGTPGELRAADAEELTVVCGDGRPVRLSGLRDISGNGTKGEHKAQPGAILSSPTPEMRAELDRVQAEIAGTEPRWRKRLAQAHPLSLPLGRASGAAPLPRTRQLDLGAVPAPLRRAIGAYWALKAAGEAGGDLAWRGLGQPGPASAGLVCRWVPMRVEDAPGRTLGALADSLEEAAGAGGGFAADLPYREPGLDTGSPDIGLRQDGTVALIPGTILTLCLDDGAVTLVHDAARLSDAYADLLARRLEALRHSDPATLLADLPEMSEAERELVLADWNRTGTPYDTACLHALIEAQVARTPDATALVFEAEGLSYAALNARANRAAHLLIGMGVRPGTLVGLSMQRSADMLVAALAILKAGGAYVPMDPAYPPDRIALYIEDSGAPIIVTDAATAPQLPSHGATLLRMDDPGLASAPDHDPEGGAGPADLAYMIYTSGSTGRPKGVMVEHRNLANFCTAMDDRIAPAEGGVWLAVTSLNFDISVLELFYTLARGFKLVLSSDENRALVASGTGGSGRGMDFSLYYWGNDDGAGRDKYRLLLEGAKFADAHGFRAVWTPERHFHAFGGPYPNPSVTGAAVAAVTRNLDVRAGSCVAPLHHTARIAEEWAVIDNLTNGRAGMAIASGWQPDDFVLRPENTPPANKPAMFDQIRDLRRLWAGEAVGFPRADGTMHEVVTQPRPVSTELPVWVTTAGNPETWRQAGETGANVLTHLLGQTVAEVAEKIGIYHQALRDAGRRPADHKVTLMLHTYVAESRDAAEQVAREPMKDYLRSAAGLIKQYAWAFPAFKKPKGVENAFELDLGSLEEEELEGILDFAFLRYFEDSGLFGTVEDCVARVEELKAIGVDEVACLIDYGIPVEQVLDGLQPLAEVLKRSNANTEPAEDDFSIAAQIRRHGVTHLQCTPSMARMIAASDEARAALGSVETLMLGGEALPGALVAEMRQLTGARILNMYGPTETTIWSSTETVESEEPVTNIGRPVANTWFYVLDEAMRPVPVGVPGELWIGGDGVTRGYWQRPDLTEERFRLDPFREEGRIYRTGDLVRWRSDGRIDFIGRADHQVKLRGYRIELGEIEAALESLPEVAQAVVVAREDRPGDPRLVAYVRGQGIEVARLRAALAELLPAHMVPAHVVTMESFPLTPNRKVDRNALPAPSIRSEPPATPPAPRPTATSSAPPAAAPAATAPADASQIERDIGAIWARILGVTSVGPRDNFFDLGGHSLLAVQAHREIRDTLGLRGLSITDIFRYPVLSSLAAKAAQDSAGTTAASRKTPPEPERTEVAPGLPVQPPPESAPAATGNARADARQDAMSRRRAMRAQRAAKTAS